MGWILTQTIQILPLPPPPPWELGSVDDPLFEKVYEDQFTADSLQVSSHPH